MSHFNFVIPLNRDDLFEAATRNQYTVENVYNTRDLKIKLQVGYKLRYLEYFFYCGVVRTALLVFSSKGQSLS